MVRRRWIMNEGNCSYITSARLDFAMMLEEENNAPPIAFSTHDGLIRWAEHLGNMKVEKSKSNRAVRIHGFVRKSWYYDQVWVEKSYGRYRSAILRHALVGFQTSKDALSCIDADHVAARTMLTAWPKAWVCLFPVPRYSNRPFGNIEKKIPKIRYGKLLELTPLMGYKIFSGFYPVSILERNQVMHDIRGQIMPSAGSKVAAFLDKMEADITPHLRRR